MQLDLLNLLLVLLAAWTAGRVAARAGYPAVLGELLVGIALGPPLLGLLGPDPALAVLAEVGVLLMMLYIGMEIDPAELKKASWGGLLAAVGGFATPFVLAFAVVKGFGGSTIAAIFVGLAAGVTSLATKSRILVDLGVMNTRIAHVMMAGALIADTISLVAFAAILGLGSGAEAGLSWGALGVVAAKAAGFFAVAGALGVWGLPVLGRWLQSRGMAGRTSAFTLVLALAVAFAELAEVAGLHGVVGAFVAGLFLRERALGARLAATLRSVVHDTSIGFLAPIFFVTAGFAVSLGALRDQLGLLVAVVAVATVGKIVGTMLFYLPTGHGWREGLTLGAGMNGRGAVEIILAGLALEAGIIDAGLFSVLVFLAVFTTATVPVLLGWGVRWLRARGELAAAGPPRVGVVVVGGGRTARTMAAVLGEGQPVTLVDADPAAVALAREAGIAAVCGDPLSDDVLAEAGADRAAVLVAMARDPGVNALVARLARDEHGVPEVHVLLGREGRGALSTLRHLDATPLFGAAVELDEWDRLLDTDEVDVVAVRAATLDESPTQPILPLAVHRDGERRPFHARAAFGDDDMLLVLRPSTG